jgi:ribosomal protein L37AE/L43A
MARKLKSIWKCPSCGSTDIQVSYPTWYRQSAHELKFVETDDAAEILWWYCAHCDESDYGRPEENT